MELVDEEDDRALGRGDLLERGLEALLELAAVLRAGDHAGEVERDHAGAAERLGHLVLRDAQREALGDRGLAHAGLADQDGVVLAPAREDLDRLGDLIVAADHRVDAAGGRLDGQVAAEGVERGRGALGLLGLRGGRLAGAADWANCWAQVSHSEAAWRWPSAPTPTTRTTPGRRPQTAQTWTAAAKGSVCAMSVCFRFGRGDSGSQSIGLKFS